MKDYDEMPVKTKTAKTYVNNDNSQFYRMIPGRTITIKKTHPGLNQQHKVSLLKQRAPMNFGYCQHDCVNTCKLCPT